MKEYSEMLVESGHNRAKGRVQRPTLTERDLPLSRDL